MTTFLTIAIGTGALLACNAAVAQNGTMMGGTWHNGWMAGYGGPWIAVVLLVLIVGLALWVIKRK